MTAAIPTQPLTTLVFLFGEGQDTEQVLAQALHEHGVLGSTATALELVSEAGREAAGSQVAVVANGLLDLDLGDLVVAGWRKHGELAAAAERTAANPGSSEVVELATQRISSAHHPYVELLVNDVRVATVTFDLEVEFVVKALVVTVRDSHVVSLHTGACDLAATLAAEGVQLASRRGHFELPLVVRLPLLLRLEGGSDPSPYGGPAHMSDVLTLSQIRMPGVAQTKEEAIREAGQILVDAGAVDPSYIDSMFDRERSVSTYMGNYLAIPHGTNESMESIRRSALSVIRYPEPIDWDGNEVLFALGIAGHQGVYMDILSRIAVVFSDTDEVDKLVAAKSAEEIYDLLNAVNEE